MTQNGGAVIPGDGRRGGGEWLGHPRGLATLFFTELWERFSYYGMRALLVLYMTAAVSGGNEGLGLADGEATAIYGIYTAFVYLLALPGGWLADKIFGARQAVFYGGSIIAAGHFTMAGPLIGLPNLVCFYLGLILIVIGTGLLKPNVSALVGELYGPQDARREAGFSIFYMGINLGGIAGPLLCGYFGENVDWHLGFSLAGFGMLLGLLQYKLGARHLGDAGFAPKHSGTEAVDRHRLAIGVVAAVLLLAAMGFAVSSGLALSRVAEALGVAIVAIALIYFAIVYFAGGHTEEERRRVVVIFWLFILAALFWSGFEQAGSSMNLFAERLTDRTIGGFEVPTSWLQTINPIFIVVLAPIFGWTWTWLAMRNANPSIPVKFALGLLGLAAGFFVLMWGAANAGPSNLASPAWLVVTYFLHTCGELCLSPVGLSSVTRLAPTGRTGQMMGIWFIGASLGSLLAGLVAGQIEHLAPSPLFGYIGMFAAVAGIVALVTAPWVKRLMGEAPEKIPLANRSG